MVEGAEMDEVDEGIEESESASFNSSSGRRASWSSEYKMLISLVLRATPTVIGTTATTESNGEVTVESAQCALARRGILSSF